MTRSITILILSLVIVAFGGAIAYQRLVSNEETAHRLPTSAVTVVVQPPQEDEELLKKRLAGIGHAKNLAPVQLEPAASSAAR